MQSWRSPREQILTWVALPAIDWICAAAMSIWIPADDESQCALIGRTAEEERRRRRMKERMKPEVSDQPHWVPSQILASDSVTNPNPPQPIKKPGVGSWFGTAVSAFLNQQK